MTAPPGIDKFPSVQYHKSGPHVGGRGVCRTAAVSPPDGGQLRSPPDPMKGGLLMMVTYSDLIQIGILIVGIIGLFLSQKSK